MNKRLKARADKLIKLVRKYGKIQVTSKGDRRQRIVFASGYIKYREKNHWTGEWTRWHKSCFVYVHSGYQDKKIKNTLLRNVCAMLRYPAGRIGQVHVGKNFSERVR